MGNLIIRKSATPGTVPGSLPAGVLFINTADGVLCWSNSSGVVQTTSLSAATTADIAAAVSGLKGGASASYDTLGEIETALGTLQPKDATLTALAGVLTAADKLIYATGSDAFSTTDFSAFGRTLVDDADASAARTTLGVAIGTNVQAYDADLAALAGLTSAADALPYFTGAGTASTTTLTTAARTVLDDATVSDMRTTLGLAIGTNVQAYDTELAALAGLTSAADALPYFTGSGTAATTTLTTAARTVLDDTTTSAMRTTLGVGTADSPQFGGIELGHATDTTISRSSAGVLAVEGVTVPLNSTSSTHTASTIELGHASDTTLSRSSAGVLAVEGVTVSLNSTSATHTAGTLELGAASDTTLSRSAAGELAVEGTVVKKVGKETIWVPAVAMYARTTNGPSSGTVEKATNKNMFKTLDFDTTTQEFAQFEIHMPKSWNLSTVTFQPVWTHAATTVNFGVVWALQGVARSDTDAGDVAFGTEQTSTDTGGTTDAIYIGPESSAITIGGTPAAGDTVQFQVKRNPANASDTMAIDARLHGIRLFFTTNASTDA